MSQKEKAPEWEIFKRIEELENLIAKKAIPVERMSVEEFRELSGEKESIETLEKGDENTD